MSCLGLKLVSHVCSFNSIPQFFAFCFLCVFCAPRIFFLAVLPHLCISQLFLSSFCLQLRKFQNFPVLSPAGGFALETALLRVSLFCFSFFSPNNTRFSFRSGIPFHFIVLAFSSHCDCRRRALVSRFFLAASFESSLGLSNSSV